MDTRDSNGRKDFAHSTYFIVKIIPSSKTYLNPENGVSAFPTKKDFDSVINGVGIKNLEWIVIK